MLLKMKITLQQIEREYILEQRDFLYKKIEIRIFDQRFHSKLLDIMRNKNNFFYINIWEFR